MFILQFLGSTAGRWTRAIAGVIVRGRLPEWLPSGAPLAEARPKRAFMPATPTAPTKHCVSFV